MSTMIKSIGITEEELKRLPKERQATILTSLIKTCREKGLTWGEVESRLSPNMPQSWRDWIKDVLEGRLN